MKRFSIFNLEEEEIKVDAGSDASVTSDVDIEAGTQAEVELVQEVTALEEVMDNIDTGLEVQNELEEQVSKNEELMESGSVVTADQVAVAQEEFYKSLSKLGPISDHINISRELSDPLPLSRLRITVEDQKGVIATIIEKIKAFFKAIKDFFVKILQKVGIIRKAQEVKHSRALEELEKTVEQLKKGDFVIKGNFISIPTSDYIAVNEMLFDAMGGYTLRFNRWADIFNLLINPNYDLGSDGLGPDSLPYSTDLYLAYFTNNKDKLEKIKSSIKGDASDKSILENLKLKKSDTIFTNFNYIFTIILQLDDSKPCGIYYKFIKMEIRDAIRRAHNTRLVVNQDMISELEDVISKVADRSNLEKNKQLIVNRLNKGMEKSKKEIEKTIDQYERSQTDLKEKWQVDVLQQLLVATKSLYSEYLKHCATNSELDLLTRLYKVINHILKKYAINNDNKDNK